MTSKEYFEAARTLLRTALRITDHMFAGRLRALAEVCERQAEKAARADAAEALARKGLNSSSPIFRSHLRLQATRAAQLAEGTLEKIEDLTAPPQERAQRRRKLTKGLPSFEKIGSISPGRYFPS